MRSQVPQVWPRLGVVLAFATGVSLHAASFSANPVADAFVTTGPSDNLRDNNYGAAGALSIAAPGSANGEFQSVLRFDASGAHDAFDLLFGPGQWIVQSVSLQLTATSPNNPVFNANAAGTFAASWMENDGWIEGSGGPMVPSTVGISYNSLTTSFINDSADQNLGTFAYNGASSGASTYALNLSAGLVNDIQSGESISLRLFAADTGISYVMNSQNFGTVANRPVLTVGAVAVPEPSMTALIGLFIGGMWLVRFARRLS